MVQQVVLYVILALCLVWLGKRFYVILTSKKEDDCGCGCGCGCGKKLPKEEPHCPSCQDKSAETKKSCCK